MQFPCAPAEHYRPLIVVPKEETTVLKLLLFCILLVLCWPLAVAALLLFPIVWLIALPFRILGFAVEGVLGVIRGLFLLPARVLGGTR